LMPLPLYDEPCPPFALLRVVRVAARCCALLRVAEVLGEAEDGDELGVVHERRPRRGIRTSHRPLGAVRRAAERGED
jgi:hypothetical protein